MKRILLLLLVMCCVAYPGLFAQTNQSTTGSWPKSLLWRISGNGLPKNSFLLGTMHLQDKRLFYFSDSLYHYLEQADGYSTEIDIREMMDTLMQAIINEKEEDDIIDKKRLARTDLKRKIIDSLIQNVTRNNDRRSKKQLAKMRREKWNKVARNKEMPTIMDAFLYGVAVKLGKWVGGIEDLQDQMPLLDELGDDFDMQELFVPDSEIAAMLEKMIGMYMSKDLDGIDRFINNNRSAGEETRIFIKRNIKMAQRMDSLAHIRSMFFAVGAAHLPGDSGVITLLRKKGYQVDPVFSSRQVDPIAYTSRLKQAPWVKIEDKSKFYTVEMPGEATDFSMYYDYFKMKVFMDITTLSYFMAGAMVAPGKIDPNKLLESIVDKADSELRGKKEIEYRGMKGIEALLGTDDYHFKLRYIVNGNILYMLMVGGEGKESTETADAKRFLASFAAEPAKTVAVSDTWQPFELKEKGIIVSLPGTPARNYKIEKVAEGTGWNFTTYHYTDERKGIYYMLQARDIRPGYHLIDDTSYFFDLRNNMKETIVNVTKDSLFKLGSYQAYSYEGTSADNSVMFKTLVVSRGNRSYILYAGGANEDESIRQMDNFLTSLTFTDYEKTAWKKETSQQGSFYTSAPSPILFREKKVNEESETEEDAYYYSYNPIDCISYQVYKETLSPYYWAANDSVLYEKTIMSYKTSEDSLWGRRTVTNGRLTGMEWIIETPGVSNLKKIRQFLNGDTLYTLAGFIPAWAINDKDKQQFFDDFRVFNESVPESVFKSKTEKLLNDLQSSDSATLAAAEAAMGNAEFTPEDRPLLHKALLADYADDDSLLYYSTRSMVINKLITVSDNSTVDFIRTNYGSLSGKREPVKYDLLHALVMNKTGYSYDLLKELLVNDPPKKKLRKDLSYRITDSVLLTRTLYPEILQLSDNSLLSERIMQITVEMLDSNLVSPDMVMPYRKNILHSADTILANLKEQVPGEGYYNGYYVYVVRLLQYFNDEESNRLLQQYSLLDDLTLKQESVLSLLKNGQTVDKNEIVKIAADNEYRIDFYDALTELGQKKLFPSKYLTQQYFAEAVIYQYASDDYQPKEVNFIEARTITYKGEKKKFYLFKIVYDYEGDEENKEQYQYLGIAGPFSANTKDITSDHEASGLYYKENYDPEKVIAQFTEYIKELEK